MGSAGEGVRPAGTATAMHSGGRLKTRDLVTGPDFLCIGMGKSGTGWLYDQFLNHPDFWMPPIKELHYLDRDVPRMITALPLYQRYKERRFEAQKSEWGARQKKDFQFLRDMVLARQKPMDLGFYTSIFRFKDDLMSGDISPSYCTMPDDLIAEIMARFPKLKIILMIRDPVARAWSHFSMKNRGDKIDAYTLQDPVKFRMLLETSKAYRTGSPATITRKWLRHVPPDQYRYYFFDDLQADPEKLKREILDFLGADPAKETELDPGHNRKADKPKLEMLPEIQEQLVRKFADELKACAEVFGSHAAKWVEKYGV
jgi:hypothetical protein